MCLVEKRGDRALGAVVLGGGSGVLEWDGGKALSPVSSVKEHSFSKSAEHFLCATHRGGSRLHEAWVLLRPMTQGRQ